MAATFSTHAEDAFTRVVDDQHGIDLRDKDFEKNFQIERCVSFLKKESYEKVALQFPDEYMKYSFNVVKTLQEQLPLQKFFILGDTTYGSCCVDEIAAEHVGVDCIIHFGRACLSKTRRLPVLFIFGESLIDVQHFCQEFKKTFPSDSSLVILLYDVSYEHAVDEVGQNLEGEYVGLAISKLLTDENEECCKVCLNKSKAPAKKMADGRCTKSSCCDKDRCPEPKEINICNLNLSEMCSCTNIERQTEEVYKRFGRKFALSQNRNLEDYSMLYIGRQSLTLTNLMMSYNRNRFYTYDPSTRVMKPESLNVNRYLMKRYFLMQKAKEAKTVGIVAGTLGVADYLLIIERMKNLLRNAGKKYYLLMMGKPNVAKMANFMEIDVFVLVACPENSLIDSQEYYRPIVTPFEMEIACSSAREWTGEYITDFRELLPGAASFIDLEGQDSFKKDEPEFSLITGNLVNRERHQSEGMGNSTDIVSTSQENAVATFGDNSAAFFLHTRSWKGLEKKLGETEVVDAVEGRTGIAIKYTHETENKNKESND